MATTEIKKILTIETKNGAQSLRDLQRSIASARAELEKATKDTDDYEKALSDVKTAQSQYNQLMRLTVQDNKAVEGSYNALVVELAKLKDQWKQTSDEAERGRLTGEINRVKEQIGELDHSIGNWHSSVGNYENAIVAAFQRMGLGIKGVGLSAKAVIPAIKSVGAALWALAKNPFVIGLSAFIALWQKLTKSLKNNEEAYDRIRIALAPLKAVGIAVQQVFDKVVGVIADAAEAVGRFLEKIGLVKGTGAELKAIAQEEDALEETRRQYRKQDAADQKEANRLRAESYKTTKYTEAERKKMLEQAIALEMGIGKRREELAQRESDVLKRRAALTANSRETNDKLAESEAAVDDAMAATYSRMGRMNSRLDNLNKTTEDATDEVNALADAWEKEGAAEADAALAGAIAAEKAANAARKKANDAELGALSTRTSTRENTARATIDDAEALAAELYRIRKEANEKRLQMLKDFAMEALKAGDMEAYLAYDKQVADTEVQIARDAENEKARLRRKGVADAKKTQQEQRAIMQQTAAMFGNVASAYQAYITQRLEGGKISEAAAKREFAAVKDIQYAQTWINTLAGMMSVWAGEGTTATKIATSAAVFTQGLAATMQIANTTLGSVAAAAQAVTSAAVAAPVVINAMPQVQTMTSASQEQVLNERAADQRVYVVYSDIQQAGRKVRVTDSESRF